MRTRTVVVKRKIIEFLTHYNRTSLLCIVLAAEALNMYSPIIQQTLSDPRSQRALYIHQCCMIRNTFEPTME